MLKVWLVFKMGGGGDKPYTKAVNQDIFSQFFKSTTKITIFSKKPGYFKDKPNSRHTSKTFQQKLCFFGGGGEGSWLFGLFSGDKDDYSDVKNMTWMLAPFRRS